MLENVYHSCGIAAVSYKNKKKNVAPALHKLLINMQNRGQLSAGITTFDDARPHILKTYKDIGLVKEVFRTSQKFKMKRIYKLFNGSAGIGHVRYATAGSNDKSYAQPFERQHGRKYKWFAMCFNGTITNYVDLKKQLMKRDDYHLILDSDTEVIMHNLSRELRHDKKPNPVHVFKNLSKKFDGAYNIAMINALGEIFAVRDPLGFRPLVWGENKEGVFVASESSALINMGISDFKDLEPGHLLYAKDGKVKISKFANNKKPKHCMFEWIYFANVSSVIDKKSVYLTRRRLGKELAKRETRKITNDHIVVPVPDTSKPAAEAMAFELGIPLMEGLIRNRYIGRTFIEGESRVHLIKNKFTIIREILKDKKVFLVDDSIVRATTVKEIIKYIKKEGGAKEVHLRITCPAIMGPCFYGIDMSTKSELLVPHYTKAFCGEISDKTSEKIAKDLGANSLTYMTHEGLRNSIGLKDKICMACLDCKYPTKEGRKFYQISLENFLKGKKDTGRVLKAEKVC
ncbi:amidophosphoribosyltransferase [Candidatus Woesearchaeota archaeon]|nr:amidophosphoribosyltransferase [Candidatus Woesearchaeota archaeon]